MNDADQTLARIDEVLGYSDDMSIEWDYSTSCDAMRSRPAEQSLTGQLSPGACVIYDESHLITQAMVDRWQIALPRMNHLDIGHPEGEQ